MEKVQRYTGGAGQGENTFWDNPPVLPMMKENDWDTGNEIRY
jgi:hypothetical protein